MVYLFPSICLSDSLSLSLQKKKNNNIVYFEKRKKKPRYIIHVLICIYLVLLSFYLTEQKFNR